MTIGLSNIRRGQVLKPPRLALYGVDGIGKTTLAAQMPKPVFLFTEPGQGALDVASFTSPAPDPFNPDASSPVLRTNEEVIDALTALYMNEHDFQTVVIDSLDAWEPLLWDFTSRKHGKANIEKFGYGKGYLAAVDEARTILAALDALCNDKNMAVMLIAHSEVKRFDAPDHEPFERYQLRLHKTLSALIAYWADAVLFTNYEVHVVTDVGKNDRETKRGVGLGKRVLYTEERPAFHAKNRYNLPPEMPLDWNTLQAAITKGMGAVAPAQAAEQPQAVSS